MIKTYNVGIVNFEWWEWFLIPSLIGIIYFLGARYKLKKIGTNPEYKYFVTGLMFKVFAGVFFGIIYIFYYGGGDTISYYSSTIPLVNLFYESPGDYFDLLLYSTETTASFGDDEWSAYTFNVFTNDTGIPLSFISKDPKTFAVCKLTSIVMIFTSKSYFASTLVLSALTFIPLWHLYRRLLKHFPVLGKELAISILFVPSVAFWGSGIMKDTYTFAALVLAVVAFDQVIQRFKSILLYPHYVLILLVALYVILSIKPYILNILIPCLGLWIMLILTMNVQNVIFKFIVLPVIFVGGIGGSFFVLQSLSESMDKFALDNAINTAVVTNEDLKREEQYGNNNFDIGELDGSIPNLVSKFPVATFAGLFRPLLIEARSPVMLLSALENAFILGLLLLTLWRIKFRLIIRLILSNPILLFCFSFAILFGFMIGITTPNFGALVRFKIPLTPFFIAGLMIIYSTNKILSSDIENPKN